MRLHDLDVGALSLEGFLLSLSLSLYLYVETEYAPRPGEVIYFFYRRESSIFRTAARMPVERDARVHWQNGRGQWEHPRNQGAPGPGYYPRTNIDIYDTTRQFPRVEVNIEGQAEVPRLPKVSRLFLLLAAVYNK